MARKPRMVRDRAVAGSNKTNYSILKPEEVALFAPVTQAVKNRETLVSYLNEQAATSIRETMEQRLDNGLLLGYAYNLAMNGSFFGKGETKMDSADIAKMLRYSQPYLRLCQRLFLRRDFLAEDMKWWEANSEKFPGFKPRKAEGLEYVWDCARVHRDYEAESDKRGPGETDEAVIARIDRKLAPPMIEVTQTTPAQQVQRLRIILHQAMRILWLRGVVDVPWDFMSMKRLDSWLASVKWDDEIDLSIWNTVKDARDFEGDVETAFFERKDPTLPPDDEADQDEGGAGGDSGDGGGGQATPIPIPPPAPAATAAPQATPAAAPVPTPMPTPAPMFQAPAPTPVPTPAPTVAAADTVSGAVALMTGADTIQPAAPSGAVVVMVPGQDGVHVPAQQLVPSDAEIARLAAAEARVAADDNFPPDIIQGIAQNAMKFVMDSIEDARPESAAAVRVVIELAVRSALREAMNTTPPRKRAGTPKKEAPQTRSRRKTN